mmetsp:Transcript_10436/g.15685  ORF Transcript_10436/g.15685 Transcript_10436/m.15685 type:complete len:247 (+) Transcript_10436:293-1033(+)
MTVSFQNLSSRTDSCSRLARMKKSYRFTSSIASHSTRFCSLCNRAVAAFRTSMRLGMLRISGIGCPVIFSSCAMRSSIFARACVSSSSCFFRNSRCTRSFSSCCAARSFCSFSRCCFSCNFFFRSASFSKNWALDLRSSMSNRISVWLRSSSMCCFTFASSCCFIDCDPSTSLFLIFARVARARETGACSNSSPCDTTLHEFFTRSMAMMNFLLRISLIAFNNIPSSCKYDGRQVNEQILFKEIEW